MNQIVDHFWFWLFLISIFLLLSAAYLCGGLNEANGWVWALLIAGVLIGIGALVWAVHWRNGSDQTPIKTQRQTPVEYPSLSQSDLSTSLKNSSVFSPIGTPTQVKYNYPQLNRGFTQTGKDLSTLASL